MLTKNHEETRKMYLLTSASFKTLNQLPLYETILTTPQAWLAFQRGDLGTSLEKFHKTAVLSTEMVQYQAVVVDILLFLPLLGCMLIQPHVPDLQKTEAQHQWDPRQKLTLLESFRTLGKVSQRFGIKNKMKFMHWVVILYNSFELLLLEEKEKAFNVIFRAMRRKDTAELFEKMRFYQLIVYSILGLYYTKNAEREVYYQKAKDMFTEMGTDYLKAWLEQASGSVR
ncbi:hypothetical protein HDV05_001683 [Chytridiales sp. JEL 0842]|nr:hypothetical protein HDV05_001683 [Chytridiales sp. JEL 0842]